MTNTISVVIPFYNGEQYLEAALDSVYGQTRKADEVIVVDDGSSPSSKLALEELHKKFGFNLLTKLNGGQASARNAGVAAARSSFICLLDQDDVYLPKHIEILEKAIPENDPRFAYVFGDVWRQTEQGVVISTSVTQLEFPQPYHQLWQMIRVNMNILPSATLINKASYLKIGGFDEQFRGYEDDDLFLRFFMEGFSRVFIPEAVTIWTLNTASTSFTESMSESRYKYYVKLRDTFATKPIPGYALFRDCLAPRFAFEFLAEVVRAAFENSPHFRGRQERLVSFAKDYFASREIRGIQRLLFRIASFSLSTFSIGITKFALNAIYPFAGVLERMGFQGARQLLQRYHV